MNTVLRSWRVTAPVALLIAFTAFALTWAFYPSVRPISTEGSHFTGYVHWVVRDAGGNVKSEGSGHNTITSYFVQDARDRLMSAATLTSPNDTYIGMAACNNNVNSALAADAQPSATLCTLSTGLAATTTAGNTGTNPVVIGGASLVRTNTTGATGAGIYSLTNTFVASGTVGPILELQLNKNPVDGVQPVRSSIGAVKNVNIGLAATDSLQVTWTITIS